MKPFGMSIAGIPVRIRSSSLPLLDALQHRFQHFVAAPGQGGYDVHVFVDEDAPHHNHISPSFQFDHQRVCFDLPGYTGFIDTASHSSLRIASDQPFNGVEYFLRVVYALLCFEQGGLMLHAAGVVRNERAFLFFGRSGAGKTTAARNALDGIVLNDDLIALLPEDHGWRAYGTPFTNPTQTRPSSASAPVAGLFRLVQSPTLAIEPLLGARALAELLTSIPVLNGSPSPPISRCRQLLDTIPAYKLFLRPDPSFWPLIESL